MARINIKPLAFPDTRLEFDNSGQPEESKEELEERFTAFEIIMENRRNKLIKKLNWRADIDG